MYKFFSTFIHESEREWVWDGGSFNKSENTFFHSTKLHNYIWCGCVCKEKKKRVKSVAVNPEKATQKQRR